MKEEYESHVKENTMYIYEFPIGSADKEAENTLLHWLRTDYPSINFTVYTYGDRTAIGVGLGVEKEDFNERE